MLVPDRTKLMKLYYTPKSHFARKVRILLDALNIKAELIDAGNVADAPLNLFANNPLMKVPALVDDQQVLFDSDHIAQYLVQKYDPDDRFNVMITAPELMNARAVLNGIMSAEVELVLAERTGIDTTRYPRFQRHRDAIKQGLDWLESNWGNIPAEPSYLNFHLVCMWEHLVMYEMFELHHPQLQSRVQQMSNIQYIRSSSPL